MKHPTASADLAGVTERKVPRAFDLKDFTSNVLDDDALSTFCRAESDMAHEIMDNRVKIDPAAIERLYTPDPRKPWAEPTVTECATRNLRPATLTIAGVELPNPSSTMDPALEDGLLTTLAEMEQWLGGGDAWGNTDWYAGPKGLDGKAYAFHIRAAIAEIQRQAAEITELQGMLEEAIGPVRLVSELAGMTDSECGHLHPFAIRNAARDKLGEDFPTPRLYGEEDRKRAAEAIFRNRALKWDTAVILVDIVAAALGLRMTS